MKSNVNRRDFLRGTAWMGAAAVVAGCRMNRFGFGEGGQMQDYAFQGLKGRTVRVGFVGVGQRGTAAVHRVSMIPGVEIVALCDRNPAAVEGNLKWLADHKYRVVPKKYVGDVAYKDLCDSLLSGDVDYNAVFAALEKIGYRGTFTAEMIPFARLPDLVLPDQALAEKVVRELNYATITELSS